MHWTEKVNESLNGAYRTPTFNLPPVYRLKRRPWWWDASFITGVITATTLVIMAVVTMVAA